MRTGIFLGMLVLCFISVFSQSSDSISDVHLSEVTISESLNSIKQKESALSVDVLRQDYFQKHLSGNFVQALEHTSGIRSMDIGMGFSKPMIRGMSFNRIAVSENGVKQEDQQWGTDHGLEIDAFNVENVMVIKGPSSLSYGGDAMGGVIDIQPPSFPDSDRFWGDITLLARSVNDNISASMMMGLKHGNFMFKARYTQQKFADYRIPADSVIYLTMVLPIINNRLKNTAGVERDGYLLFAYEKGGYKSNYVISNTFQKTGFFIGAHGVPDASRLNDDRDYYNIDLPYSKVNHLKLSSHQRYAAGSIIYSADMGYQRNDREEWSAFHTHYSTLSAPSVDPDKELSFTLQTLSSDLNIRILNSSSMEHTFGVNIQGQKNTIGGYSFLLPEYERYTAGGYYIGSWRPSNSFTLNGGIRYDWGNIDIMPYKDPYEMDYLRNQGYDEATVSQYEWRCRKVNKSFGDYSGSIGFSWIPSDRFVIKMNLGRCFRLPGPNELASNGVHHGAFRHEQGDASLLSERGWQTDGVFQYEGRYIDFSVSPFFSLYDNFIYLRPTGIWSALPHAGQIYRYSGVKAILSGGEINMSATLSEKLNYKLSGEYVYTYNMDDHTALSFSPPATMRNTLTWSEKRWSVYVENQCIAPQNRVSHNEDRTKGANLFHMGWFCDAEIGKVRLKINLTVQNMFDTRYFNHLSFYRKIEIPEAGRNIQFSINLPFN